MTRDRACDVDQGAALLKVALQKKWVAKHLDSWVPEVTKTGRREISTPFGFHVSEICFPVILRSSAERFRENAQRVRD